MPNWCDNTLTVSGSKKSITNFKKQAKGKETALSLNKLYPMPKALKNTEASFDKFNKTLIKQYGASNWYEWRIKKWGTKWDIEEAKLINDGYDWLDYHFLSAWSPPIESFIKISKKYPSIAFTLKYDETGMGFMGIAKFYKGKVSNKIINY